MRFSRFLIPGNCTMSAKADSQNQVGEDDSKPKHGHKHEQEHDRNPVPHATPLPAPLIGTSVLLIGVALVQVARSKRAQA